MSERILRLNKRMCSVPQCSKKAVSGISFHKFPNDPQRKKKWAIALKIGKPVSNCSNKKKPSLKKGTVPSQNLPQSSIPPRKWLSPQKRARALRAATRAHASRKLCLSPHYDDWQVAEVAVAEDPTCLDAAGALIELRQALGREESATFCVEPIEAIIHGTRDVAVQVTPSLLDTQKFSISNIVKTDKQLRAFTGVSTNDRFNKILSKIEEIEAGEGRQGYAISCRNRLLLCLVKLKLNLSYVCISVLFEVSPTSCQKYFGDMIERLGNLMRCVIRFPSVGEIQRNMPSCFEKYKKTRIVLDCTEVKIEKTKCLKCRISTYSHYKGCHTMKTLIGTSPSGLVTYVSPCFAGRSSDKAIFIRSKLMEKIAAGEAIMVDKGFLIEAECLEKGISLIRPPFLKDRRRQMTPKDASETASIASARVHVERAIQRLKIFKILRTDLSYDILPYCDSIMTTIAGLCNLSSPILAHDKF